MATLVGSHSARMVRQAHHERAMGVIGPFFPFVPVSSTGQALSVSKGVNGGEGWPAPMVRQAHHERAIELGLL